jgi:hypothetical protein
MLKKSLMVALVAVAPISPVQAMYYDSIYAVGREHQCDAPILAADIHAEHGVGHCSNTTSDGIGHQGNCTDTVRTAGGALWSGEWLTCGPGDGPNGSTGCDYIFVVRCNGAARSGEIQMGLNPAGNYPACEYQADGDEWICDNLTSGPSGYSVECYCTGSAFACH